MGVRILVGDVRAMLETLPDESVHCVVTSPPYWGLRDYGVDGQLGLEPTPGEYVAKMVEVFREVRRVLRTDGTLWLNLGDSYANTGAADSSKVGGFTGDRIRNNRKGIMDSRPRGIPSGLKPKDLVGIPWRLAFALQADGWWLRQDIIWSKPNPMPESVRDRCTKAHEYIFLLTKSERYWYDAEAISEEATGGDPGNVTHKHVAAYENGDDKARTKAGLLSYSFKRRTATEGKPGAPKQHREDRDDIAYYGTRNKRSVWTITTKGFSEAHFATFPPELPEICIKAGCPPGGVVLDPFFGAGTTGLVADRLGRDCIGIELNPAYADMARRRILGDAPLLATVSCSS